MQQASALKPRDDRSAASSLLLAWLFLFLIMPFVGARTSRPALPLAIDEPVKSWPVESKRWALIIGVSDYEDAGLAPLKSASADAHLLADTLKQYAGFPQQNIYLMTSDQPKEWQPRRSNL